MYMYAHFLCGGCYIRICPTERVACARVCVSCVEGGVGVCVLPRGSHVRGCGFPVWRVGCAYVSYRKGGMCACVGFQCGGWCVRVCPTARVACVRVWVSSVEGGVCVCVLPRGWHVHVCGFPVWRVACACVSYLEGGMCAGVGFLCGGWRGRGRD